MGYINIPRYQANLLPYLQYSPQMYSPFRQNLIDFHPRPCIYGVSNIITNYPQKFFALLILLSNIKY